MVTDTPDMFEGRLVGYSKQSRKDGDWIEVRFHIHPNDVTPALAAAPLKTIFMVAAVPAQKTEKAASEPEKPGKRHWDEIPLAEQAGIRCNDDRFVEWLVGKYHSAWQTDEGPMLAQGIVRRECHVNSRSEIQEGTKAALRWRALDREFQQAHGLITEER